MPLDDDSVGSQIGGESADAPADLGDPTLMGMPADQVNPLGEVEPTIETNDATNNVQPPARDISPLSQEFQESKPSQAKIKVNLRSLRWLPPPN